MTDAVNESYFPSYDTNRTAKITTSYASDFVVQKRAWSIRTFFTLLKTTGIKRFLFDPSEMIPLGYDVYHDPFRVSVTAGPVRMSITTDFTYTAADTEYGIFNRYGLEDDSLLRKMKVYSNITGLVINSEPLGYVVGGLATNQASGGGVSAGENIYVFERDKKYLLSFYNDQGASENSTVSIQYDWYE